MPTKNYYLFIFLSLLISTCLITHLIFYNIKSSHNLTKKSNKQIKLIESPKFSDDSNQEKILEEINRRIMKERAYTHDKIHLSEDHFKKEMMELQREYEEKFGKKNNLRRLSENNQFNDVSIFEQATVGIFPILRLLYNTASIINPYKVVVYPYQFDFFTKDINGTKTKLHCRQGAYLVLDPKDVDPLIVGNKSENTISINKARTIQNADIAILSIYGFYLNDLYTNSDYFSDNSEWAYFFYSYIYKLQNKLSYEEFIREKAKNPGATFSILINETDIQNGFLMDDKFPRFGILVIPDFYLSAEIEAILLKLGPKGIQNIKNFYNNGGVIFANGKSGVLLEEFGLVAKNTYDRSKILLASEDHYINTKGCEGTFDKAYNDSEDDFDKQLICNCMKSWRGFGLSSTYLTKKLDPSFKTLIEINSSNKKLKISEEGIARNLTEEETKYLPLISHKSNDKNGHIFLLNFNPLDGTSDRIILVNLVALALSKELYMTSKAGVSIKSQEIRDTPIPAGESGIYLEINTLIHNLDNKNMNNGKLYVFLPENFGWQNVPSQCIKKDDYSIIPNYINSRRTFNTTNPYLYCDIGIINKYEKKSFDKKIIILNYKATQEKYNVQIMESIFECIDYNNNLKVMEEHVKLNCEPAALLRVSINPDPSSNYPLKGQGLYFDNSVRVENKEETEALDVEYIGLIPLISPLTDADDQSKISHRLKFLPEYYINNKFKVPFPKEGADQDFIYSGELSNKNITLVPEWDSPILPVKEILEEDRRDNIKLGEELSLSGINMALLTLNSTIETLKQINYRNSDRFYKLASQRLMIYIDDTDKPGMETLYHGFNNIPEEWKDNIYKNRSKKEFIFVRNDVFFYDNENYVNPEGITEKILISVDNYIKYVKNKSGCKNKRGEVNSKIIEKGYFTHEKKDILKPNIWSNEMFEYCDLNVINPTNKDELEKYFGDQITLSHYLIPNIAKDIQNPSQIYDFTKVNDHYGYHTKYPSIKFIYIHSLIYTIKASTCIYGGKIIMDVSSYTNIIPDYVTVSPDQIAIYKTVKENNKIIIYFKRGLMSYEQYGKDLKIQINIENISVQNEISFTIALEEVKYDISFPPEYERYYKVSSGKYTFNYISSWSFPAIEIKSILNRTLNGYEMMEPFSRYGIYYQELNHRTIYGTIEAHQETSPGIVGNYGYFSSISNLGISSIPLIEYLSVGKGQVIPSGISTSRISWKDIWGRTWHQPLRSTFPDICPLPPPVKNFIMTTTYEIFQGGKQIYEWPSDERAQIRLHIKLLNNYQKYFEITRCKENQIRFVPRNLEEDHSREYGNKSNANLADSDFINKQKVFLKEGGFASYGKCFSNTGAKVGGVQVNGELKDKIEKAKLCADSTDQEGIKQCEKDLEDIVTLDKYKGNDTNKAGKEWNYSPLVEKYYPKGYILDDMWDLTHIEYDNTNMDKGYKYHIDNILPNYDNPNTRPHNIIVVPIYKGLGYSITYNKTNKMFYYGEAKYGWWSDNLQNKDNTLLAGQDNSNEISVSKSSLIKKWIFGNELKGNNDTTSKKVTELIEKRNKNIYLCKFNRRRPDININVNKKHYLANVNENNVIPILIDLEKNDKRLTEYKCIEDPYTSQNISQEEGNYLMTPTSKDYLYFAANLRAEAKETLNVLMNLEYFKKIKYEGNVKINEGGRFTYWNPVNGPNSYLVVDDPVNIIKAKRNDIEIINKVFPWIATTYNSVIYHLYNFKDKSKINKQWPYQEFYTNSYGFGDVAVSIYVGGIRKSKPVLQPGKTTYARIIFYNNCGFDWNMKVSAIDFKYEGNKPLNAHDLYKKYLNTIRVPLKYNFFKYILEKKYEKYITIEPSDHNSEVAPEFFDYENINVVTVRDGFKGEYNLKINVKKDFPDNLRGKPIEIKIDLNTSYFDRFPGTDTDPIKSFHKYKVKIPPIYIAIPFKEGHPYAGEVLYTSAQATNLDLSCRIGIDWKIDGIKYVDEEIIEQMKNMSEKDNKNELLKKIWDGIKSKEIKYEEQIIDQEYKKLIFNKGLNEDFPYFPRIEENKPDTAEVNILVKSSVAQLPYGRCLPIDNLVLKYKQWNGSNKNAYCTRPYIDTKGAWISLTYTRYLVEINEDGKFVKKKEQKLFYDDEGLMVIQFELKNLGNEDSFNTRYEIKMEQNIDYISNEGELKEVKLIRTPQDQTIITFDLNRRIAKASTAGGKIYVYYHKYLESLLELKKEDINKLPKSLKITQESSAIFDLTEAKGENEVTQRLRKPLTFDYSLRNGYDGSEIYIDMIISGRRKNPKIELKPKIKLKGSDTLDNIKMEIIKLDRTLYNNLENLTRIKVLYKENNYIDSVDDEPNEKEMDDNYEHNITYIKKIKFINGYYSSNNITYDQTQIGMSDIEISLLSISLVFILISGVFIFLGVRNCKIKKSEKLEEEIKEGKIDKLLDE